MTSSPGASVLRSPAVTPVPTRFVGTTYPLAARAKCAEAVAADPAMAPYRGSLERLIAKDQRTIVFDLCAPDPVFLTRLAGPSLVVNDAAWLTANLAAGGPPDAAAPTPNGTGPFQLETWQRGAEIHLDRFAGYRRPSTAVGALVFRWEPDPAKRLAALKAGSVDGIDALDAAAIAAAADDPELVTRVRDGSNVMYLGMNDRYAPFDQVAVRRAITQGIDRQALIDAAFPAGTSLASHISPCSAPDGCVGDGWWATDVPAAKDSLTQAGFQTGFHTKIQYSPEPRDYLPDPAGLARALQRQLADNLGIQADLEAIPFAELVARADAGTLEGIHLLGARGRFPDPSAYLGPRLGAASSAEFGDLDPSIATALSAAGAELDPAPRTKAWAKANDLIRSLVPLIPLAHVGSTIATRSDVTGVRTAPDGAESFVDAVPGDRRQFVWMQASEPSGLYCPDQTDPAALRVCAQLFEGLYRMDGSGSDPIASLAERCTPNAARDVWTCRLRPNVRFHDGSTLDANDVVLSFAVQWDATHPLHRAGPASAQGFIDRFGPLLHTPAAP